MNLGLSQQKRAAGAKRRLSTLRAFGANASGASALEFALVATPLILTLLAVLEVGLVYFATFNLESATAQGARLIRTGQAQTQGFNATQFKTEVCKHIIPPITCDGLRLDVRHYTSFGNAGANPTTPLDGSGNLKANFSYDPGTGGDVVVVRAFFEWPLTALFPRDIDPGNMQNGDRLLAATAVFRNEPFQQ
ncbi:MAG TPA: TadE/TadG family type IV pilus assembly protein [Methyloceanibacter sp.]|nr:TadE/TadG family type IV pilus assembly protein [Methyloceanibacter sp.]